MNEQLPPTVPPMDADLGGWHKVAEEMHDWHPALQEAAKAHLEQRGIEISPEHHQTHIDIARPAVPDIDDLSPEEQDFVGEVVELGKEAVQGDIIPVLGESTQKELQKADPESLHNLLQQARDSSVLWGDEVFLDKLSEHVITIAESASRKTEISSKEVEELQKLGIIQDVGPTEQRIFACENFPGTVVTHLVRKFGIEKYDHFLTRTWASEASPHLLLHRIGSHLRALKDLHERDAAAPKEIFDRFGIIHFGRYTTEQLMSQLNLVRTIEQGGERPASTIVVVSATGDHSGAMDEISPQVDHGNAIDARTVDARVPPVIFVEASQPDELGENLSIIANKVAPISSLFINAHGNEGRIHLSSRGGGWLSGAGVGLFDHFNPQESMTTGAEVCLKSCTTGVEYGVAEELSDRLGKRVYATSRSAYSSSKPFAFEKDEHGDWHYVFGFSHNSGNDELSVGHVFGDEEMLNGGMPSTAEMIWRGIKKPLHRGRTVRPSYISRRSQQRKASKLGARRFNVHD